MVGDVQSARSAILVEALIEERLTAVEAALAEIQRRLPSEPESQLSASNWLERIIGSFEDEPAFDEVIAHGRAIRVAEHCAF